MPTASLASPAGILNTEPSATRFVYSTVDTACNGKSLSIAASVRGFVAPNGLKAVAGFGIVQVVTQRSIIGLSIFVDPQRLTTVRLAQGRLPRSTHL